MKSRRQKTEEPRFAWKEKHMLGIKTQNGQTYWRHTRLPLPVLHPRRPAGVKLPSCLTVQRGDRVMAVAVSSHRPPKVACHYPQRVACSHPQRGACHRPQRGTCHRPQRAACWARRPVGRFAAVWGCEQVVVLFLEPRALLAQAREIPPTEPEMTWFVKGVVCLQDREARVNHVQPLWGSCFMRPVCACTVTRPGSTSGNPAQVFQHGLCNVPMEMLSWLTYKHLRAAAALTWAGISSCWGCAHAVQQQWQCRQSWRTKGSRGAWLHLGLLLFFLAKKNKNIFPPPTPWKGGGGKVQEYFKYLLFFLRGKNAMWFHSSHANIYVSKGEARSERKAGFGCDMGFGARDVDLLLAQAQIACLTLGQSRSPLCPQLPSCSSPHF